MGRLDRKIAIVTGAASGIGEAQAKLFVREGARVVIADIDPNGQKVSDALGEAACFVSHDVADESSWDNLVAAAEDRFGIPTILVNTAGIAKATPLAETTLAEFDRQYRVNQLGVFLGMRRLIEPMRRAGGGSIVNIASAAGLHGIPGLSAYSATKWAVRGMSRVAALELAPFNIRVNTIFPGHISTPLSRRQTGPEGFRPEKPLPIRRIGDPHEIATATLFLVSDEASYVVGAEFAVDGGMAL